ELLRIRAVAHRRLVDPDRRELLRGRAAGGFVAPQADLRLDPRRPNGAAVARFGLLAVDIRRQPEAGEDVRPPAVDVEEQLLLEEARERLVDVAADPVEPDDVELTIFHPDAAGEAVARVALRLHIEDEAARLAEELAPHELEVVPLAIEQPPVRRAHRRKPVRLELRRE